MFEQAGFQSTNFLKESSSTLFFVVGFIVIYLPLFYCKKLLLSKCRSRDNCLMRQIRGRKLVLRAFLFRAMLESYFGLGISALICVFNDHAWRF